MMPMENGPLALFNEQLAEGKFLLQRCSSNGKWIYPPRALDDSKQAWHWDQPSGLATVYATTTVSRREDKGGDYNIAIVELDEGPRMMSRVIGVSPSDVQIGQRVRAIIGVPDFGPLSKEQLPAVLFELTAAKGSE